MRVWAMPVLLVGLLLATGVAFHRLARGLRQHAEGQAQAVAGDWRVVLDGAPAWIPPGFEGQLADLALLPRQSSLVGSAWRDRLRESLAAHPWVRSVHRVDRDGPRIRFTADLARPVVGIRSVEGFLLCDSGGRVIDHQPGERLHEAWRIPSYRPEAGPLPVLRSGSLLVGPEYDELFDLLEVLWGASIYARYADLLPRLFTRSSATGDRFWWLVLEAGPDLDWGRAPGRVDGIDAQRKVDHLLRVLKVRHALGEVPSVRLWEGFGPLVGVAP